MLPASCRRRSRRGPATYNGNAMEPVNRSQARTAGGLRPEERGGAAGAALLGRTSSFKGKLVVSFPTLAADLSPAGRAELERLSGGAPAQQGRAARASALAAAKLLIDSLGRLGRDLTREGLVRDLEGVYRFATGLTPPLTYGPNARVGAAGAWVVGVDPASGAITGGEWVGVE